MMTTVGKIYQALDRMAPFKTQEKWDNSGLLAGDAAASVARALVVLDITPASIQEAVRQQAQLIISHHPVIFQPLKRLERGSVVYELVQSGLSAICAHTNLDKAAGGVNDCLARALGLGQVEAFGVEGRQKVCQLSVLVPKSCQEAVCRAVTETAGGCAFTISEADRFVLQPELEEAGAKKAELGVRIEVSVPAERLDAVLAAVRNGCPEEEPAWSAFEQLGQGREIAIGRVGELAEEVAPKVFAAQVSRTLGAAVRLNRGGRAIRRVAVLGGAGGGYLYEAAAMGADALVTGEAKHHEYLDAQRLGVTLLDATHYATEQVVLEPLADYLRRQFPEIEWMVYPGGDVLQFIEE